MIKHPSFAQTDIQLHLAKSNVQGVSEFLSAPSRSVPLCYSLSLIKLYPVVPREIVGPKRLGPDYFLDLTPQSSAEEITDLSETSLNLGHFREGMIDNCLDRIRYGVYSL